MRTLASLTGRAFKAGTTLTVVGLIAHATFSSRPAKAAGTCDPVAAAGTTPPTTCACADIGLVNPVYMAGSSAVSPVIDAISPALASAAEPLTLVYTKAGGSCDGVNSIVTNAALTASATFYLAGSTIKYTCQLNGENANVGLSDVFPTSCPSITTALLSGVTDTPGPIQSMNFVTPFVSTQTSISAEAAYLAVGFGAAATNKTPWNVPANYAFRNFQSGTETMLATAINVPTNKWPAGAADKGGSGGVLNAVAAPTADPETTLGVLASNEADGLLPSTAPAHAGESVRKYIKRLAYQHYGQTCAYYPDSSFGSLDKHNVREGHYAVWGPLHMLTKAASANTKKALALITEAETLPNVDVVGLEIDNNTVPQCAMKVQRKAEMGPITPYTPEHSCGCFFDSKRGDAAAKAACTPLACTPANAATKCKGATPACNHGFCEAN